MMTGLGIAGVSSLIGAAVGVGVWAGTAGNTLDGHGVRLDGQSQRIERLEAALPEIREDLREIKVHLRYLRGQAAVAPGHP